MKKLALNLLKSADEKIRSISKQPGGSKPVSPSAPEPVQREEDNMAERRIQQRQGRRDRFRGTEGGRGDKAEVKRRSRSEGPTNRVSIQRQSTDEPHQDDFASYGKKNEKIVGPIWAVTHSSTATRVSRYSPPLSDDGSLIQIQSHQRRIDASDSDSNDSDTKIWTKNPLQVRKVKKSGKPEKKQSNNENGFSTGIPVRNPNRDSFVYYGSQDKSEGGGGSLKGSKYQKLEEMRRKRIDIQMTSDEENTPESRISRLRQRAIQSGLGKQPVSRPDSFRQSAYIPSSPTQNYSPKSHGAFFQGGSDPRSNMSSQAANRPSVIQSSSYQSVNGVPSSAFGSKQSGGQTRQNLIRPFDPKGFSDSGISSKTDAPANANRSHQNEPRSPVIKTTVYSSSPESVVKRPFDRPRVPSVDSIYDGSIQPPEPLPSPGRDYSKKLGSGTTYQNVGHGFVFMRPASSGTMEVPKGDLVKAPHHPVQSNQGPRSNFNEVVELRLKSNRLIDQSPTQNVLSQQRRLRANIAANSDDSLDELIESNIQYLESEIESGRMKKGSAPVSRSASLPDPRRSSGIYSSSRPGPLHSGVLPTSYAATQQPRSTYTIPSQPHVNAGNELNFHIPLSGTQVQAPEIRIAKENRPDVGLQTTYAPPPQNQAYNSNYLAYAAPPERKLSYDSRSAGHVPSDYLKDSFSKSDTQLNTARIVPTFRDDVMYPVNSHPKSNSADQLVPGGPMIVDNLSIPYFDRGMFSDVDYDIEVSERVNRWEKYMKKRNDNDLDTIQERSEQDLLPRNIRRSVYVEQKLEIPQSPVGPVSQSFTWSNLQTLKPSSSDPTIHLAADPQVIAQETNRVFQLIREPTNGGRYHTATSAVSTFYHAPVPQKATGGVLTAAELREQMMAHKQPAIQPPDDVSARRVRNLDGGNRVSRYMELQELQDAKSDSVKDLCRRFDLDFDEEDNEEMQKLSPSKRDQDTDWGKLISDLEDKIKETEVWSPNMESNQGDMVSIERVKARTLQTIPFSEDPFWKEIEEMTSFEKMFNGTGLDDPLTFKQQLDYPHSQSYTLPTQPRTSARDRMHRSKSLYTPNITPLTISVDKYNAPSALDDVLDDIKTSLEKQSSPKFRKAGDSSDSLRSSPGPPYPEVMSSTGRPRTYAEPSGNYFGETRLGAPPANAPPQGLLTYASQQPPQAIPSMQEYANVVNGNYQLDPNLLKQKLINTGLAEENVTRQSGRIRPKPPPPLIVPRTSNPPAIFPLTQPEPLKSQPLPPPNIPSSEEKINQVNQSMEDLRQIAKDVETKINQIKTKLVRADENNLDKILLTLRKFAPAVSPKSFEPHHDSFQDFYVKKKSKLSDALTELERIYKSLNLDDDSLLDRADRRDYPSYRAPVVTERPEQKMETSSISFQVSNQNRLRSTEQGKKPKADIDAISKSFQAILDEVNQTSAVVGNRTTSNVPSGQRHVNQASNIGPSPEPPRKFIVPQVPQVSPTPYQPKPRVGVSPELQRKPAPLKTGIPRPVNLPVSSPEPTKKTLTFVSSSARVVPTEAQTIVQNPPLQKGASGKAFVPIPKKAIALDDPQRQNLQANVSKLMNQSGIPSHSQSVSIILKSPGTQSTAGSQTSTTVSSSQTTVPSVKMNPPAVAPRERRSRGRFRSKNPDVVEDDVAVRKARSKSTPRADTQSTGVGPSPTSADYLNIRETTPPQSQIRLRPEKDADVMHDDMAYRSLRKDVTVEAAKEPVASSKVEFQIKQPSILKSEKTFEVTEDTKVRTVSSPQGSPKQRTVETQTSTDEVKRKNTRSRLLRNTSGSKTTDSKRKGGKFGQGVARMVEIFSSSDEERSRRSRPLHTRSAPDLTLDFDDDGDLIDESCDNDVGSRTLSHVKTQTKVDVDKAQKIRTVDSVTNTEPVSDVSTPNSPSTKPPVHPLKKQSSSPDKTPVLAEKVVKDVSDKADLDNIDKPVRSPRLNRGRSAEREVESDSAILDKPERPKSFHELLASFEPNTSRFHKLRSLRKCASEDTVTSETVVQKTYQSEPYHSEPDLTDGRRKAPSREGPGVTSPASRNVVCTAQARMNFKSELVFKVGMCTL